MQTLKYVRAQHRAGGDASAGLSSRTSSEGGSRPHARELAPAIVNGIWLGR